MIQEETENKNPSKTVTEIEILNNEKLKNLIQHTCFMNIHRNVSI